MVSLDDVIWSFKLVFHPILHQGVLIGAILYRVIIKYNIWMIRLRSFIRKKTIPELVSKGPDETTFSVCMSIQEF